MKKIILCTVAVLIMLSANTRADVLLGTNEATFEAYLLNSNPNSYSTPTAAQLTLAGATTIFPAYTNPNYLVGSNYIGADAQAAGIWVFGTGFTAATPLDITLGILADNWVADVILKMGESIEVLVPGQSGTLQFNSDGTSYGTWGAFREESQRLVVNIDNLIAGSYELFIVVQNTNPHNGVSPIALSVEGGGTQSNETTTPEPATLAILGIGLIGGVLAAKSRKR